MIGKIVTLSLLTIFIIAFMIRSPSAQEIPCIGKEESKIFEPSELVRGYGIREGALIKLSVTSEGHWILTLSPPELQGAVCLVFMGTDWKFVTSKATKEEVKYGRSD